MRHVYLVAYDVADSKRLRRTYKKLQGYGDSLQYSVFRCELTAAERQQLKGELWDILDLAQDRVMIVNLGPVGKRGDDCVEFWGTPRALAPTGPTIV